MHLPDGCKQSDLVQGVLLVFLVETHDFHLRQKTTFHKKMANRVISSFLAESALDLPF